MTSRIGMFTQHKVQWIPLIYYMELVDEHPYSYETMRSVSDLLLHTVNSEHQNDYAVLVGDGKKIPAFN